MLTFNNTSGDDDFAHIGRNSTPTIDFERFDKIFPQRTVLDPIAFDMFRLDSTTTSQSLPYPGRTLGT